MPAIDWAGSVEVQTTGSKNTTHLRFAWVDTPMCMPYNQEACMPSAAGANECVSDASPTCNISVAMNELSISAHRFEFSLCNHC